MLVSKNWLANFVQLNEKTNLICDKLTALGLEVETVNKAAPEFKGVVVGKVIELERHPDADKLRVAKVDIATDEPLQIVCGAPNVAIDMIVPVATVGAVLPGNFKIKKSKLRGVESYGMLCSESELGLVENASGLMALPHDFPIGENVRELLDLDDDIIEVGLTPNRGDCLSMLGVARELAVAFGRELTVDLPENASGEGSSPQVTVSAPDACPYYIARTISGINNTLSSPLWLVERLRRLGIRSLSPVVDVTNYVMLALGAPMHAFNGSAIDGEINVRFAEKNENLTLLDGKDVKLDSDMLVIADREKSLALAGIMGGANSVIDEKTTEIVLESAWFSPPVISGRARRIALHTDASHRFERGVDFNIQQQAIDLATQLIIEISGGKAHESTVVKNTDQLPQRSAISFTAEQVDQVLGVQFPKDRIVGILTALGMDVEVVSNAFKVTPPSYRFDIAIAEDLIEELARVWGYENIPVSAVKTSQLSNQKKQNLNPRRKLHQLLNDMGYSEGITYSFIDQKTASLLSDTKDSISLMNPLSAELAVMRTSLLPSLAKTLSHNVNRQQTNVRLYEFGHGYTKVKEELLHTEKLSGIVTGDVQPMQWGYRERNIDFFDIKGDVERIFEQLNILSDISYQRSQREFLHPGQSADVFYQGESIGFIGALHPNIEKTMDFATKVFAFELDIVKIMHLKLPIAETLSKYPEIRRDISVLMAQGHQSDDIVNAIRAVDNTLVTNVCLFDVYIGRNIPRNTKSMAIAIYLQDKVKTLTDEQADAVITQITEMLSKKFNAELRG